MNRVCGPPNSDSVHQAVIPVVRQIGQQDTGHDGDPVQRQVRQAEIRVDPEIELGDEENADCVLDGYETNKGDDVRHRVADDVEVQALEKSIANQFDEEERDDHVHKTQVVQYVEPAEDRVPVECFRECIDHGSSRSSRAQVSSPVYP